MTRLIKYKADQMVEAGVAEFLDLYFYSKLKADVARWSDTQHQFAGVDVTVNNANFDEKVKVRGCLNKVYGYPSFEVSMLNKNNYVQDGWFTQALSTDYYAYISVYSYGDDENAISSSSQISACDVLWVKKQDVVSMVEQQMTMQQLKADAEELREDDFMLAQKKRKTYPHRMFWLTYSCWLAEKPVNLVVPRDTLENLPHSAHFIVTKQKATRI